MNESVLDGVRQTRDELGSDIYVFVEGDQRNFLADPITLGIAAWVVGAFLRGFTEAARGDIENWGKRTYKWLRDRVKSVFDGTEADGLDQEIASAIEARRAIADSDVVTYAEASDQTLRSALADYGLDWASAERVAAKAREAGLKALGV